MSNLHSMMRHGAETARAESPEARLRRLKEKTSRPGWDGPRSGVIPSQRWEAAEGLLVVVARETNAPPAFVAPGGDGSNPYQVGQCIALVHGRICGRRHVLVVAQWRLGGRW